MTFVAIGALRVKHIKYSLNHENYFLYVCEREEGEREEHNFVALSVLSRFAIISLRERESWMLYFCCISDPV